MKVLLLIGLIVFYFIMPLIVTIFVKNKKILNIMAWISLIIFLPILFVGVFGKIDLVNVKIDFEISGGWFDKTFNFLPYPPNLQDFLINVFMLIPIGIFVATVANKKVILKSILFGFLLSLFIEVMQFILPIARSPQLSDIILNMLSSLIGCLFIIVVIKIKQKVEKRTKKGN